jgi:hypothetical protein
VLQFTLGLIPIAPQTFVEAMLLVFRQGKGDLLTLRVETALPLALAVVPLFGVLQLDGSRIGPAPDLGQAVDGLFVVQPAV